MSESSNLLVTLSPWSRTLLKTSCSCQRMSHCADQVTTPTSLVRFVHSWSLTPEDVETFRAFRAFITYRVDFCNFLMFYVSLSATASSESSVYIERLCAVSRLLVDTASKDLFHKMHYCQQSIFYIFLQPKLTTVIPFEIVGIISPTSVICQNFISK